MAATYDPLTGNVMDMCSCEVVSIREYISEVAETTEVIEGPLLSPVVDRFTSIYELRRSFSDHDVVHKEEETYQFEAKPDPLSPPQYADTTDSPLCWRTSTIPKGQDLRRPSSRKIKVYSKPVNFSNDWKESECTDRKIVLESRVSELEAQKQSLEKSVEVLKIKLKAAENEIQAAKLDLTDFVPRKLFLEQADELATEKERALQLKLKCGELESARLSLDEELSIACAQFEAKRQCYEKRIQNLQEELEEKVTGASELKNPSPGLTSVAPVTPRTQTSQDQNGFHEESGLRRVEKKMWSEKPIKGANMRDVCDVPDRNWEDLRQGYHQDMETKPNGTEKLPPKSPVNNTDRGEVPLGENKTRVQYTNGDQENISHLEYVNENNIGEKEHDGAQIKQETATMKTDFPHSTKNLRATGMLPYSFEKVATPSGSHETEVDFLKECLQESQRKIIQLQTKIAQLGQRSDASAKTKLVQTDPCENGLNETQRTLELPHWEREFPLEDTETFSNYKPTGLPSTRIYSPSSDGGDKLYEVTDLSSQYPLTRRPRPKTSLPPNYLCQPNLQLQAERNALVHFVADTIAAVVDANNNECSQIAKQLGLQPIHTKLPNSILSVRDRNCHLRPGAQTSPFYLSFMRDIAWQNWTAVLAESLAGLSASCGMVLKKVALQTEELFRSSKHLADTRSLIASQIQIMQDFQKQARKTRVNRLPQRKKKENLPGVSFQGSYPEKRGLLDQDTRIRYTHASASTPHLNLLDLRAATNFGPLNKQAPHSGFRNCESRKSPGFLITQDRKRPSSSICSFQTKEPIQTLSFQSMAIAENT
ncbi:hypothetical protein CRM22_006258 [Opisthorchis felineus]|uniref:Uncharacterized protein n=1 Tax=Opisthorchis felineus TaxID=147828 RepID=A0A4S2LM29_OPIFE|nr:hypothetical protein CRM22_006258 [Opisthorchis felineus]